MIITRNLTLISFFLLFSLFAGCSGNQPEEADKSANSDGTAAVPKPISALALLQKDMQERRWHYGFDENRNWFLGIVSNRIDCTPATLQRKRSEIAKKLLFEAFDCVMEELEATIEIDQSSSEEKTNVSICGLTMLANAETFQNGFFEIAAIYCLNVNSCKFIQQILEGEPIKGTIPSGNASLTQWLEDQPLAEIFGPRQYVDDKGVMHLLGIASCPENATPAEIIETRIAAEALAGSAFEKGFTGIDKCTSSTFSSDGKVSKNCTVEVDGMPSEKVIPDLFRRILLRLPGRIKNHIQRVMETTKVYPLTGEEVRVFVYDISSDTFGVDSMQ